jgi:hypothetical protein
MPAEGMRLGTREPRSRVIRFAMFDISAPVEARTLRAW